MRVRLAGLTLLSLVAALPAVAQQPPAQPRRAAVPAPERVRPQMQERMAQRRGMSPEALLRMREELGLTEQQVTRLEALRQEGLAARRQQMTEMMELRSELQAGRITREAARERMQARAEAHRAARAQQPMDRAREVLTDQQRLRLAERQVDQMRRQMQGRAMREMRQRPNLRPGRPGPAARGAQQAVPPELRQRMIERMRQRDSVAPRAPMRRPAGSGR